MTLRSITKGHTLEDSADVAIVICPWEVTLNSFDAFPAGDITDRGI